MVEDFLKAETQRLVLPLCLMGKLRGVLILTMLVQNTLAKGSISGIEGLKENDKLGLNEAEIEALGETERLMLGLILGDNDKLKDDESDGLKLSDNDGDKDSLGETDGLIEIDKDGLSEGEREGEREILAEGDGVAKPSNNIWSPFSCKRLNPSSFLR